MKKVIMILMAVLICTGLLVGCGRLDNENYKIGIPHNPSIALDEKQGSIIKKDGLIIDEELNRATGGKRVDYITNNNVAINNISFKPARYQFENSVISSIDYLSIPDQNKNADELYEEMEIYFNAVYGEPESNYAFWKIKQDSGEVYEIALVKADNGIYIKVYNITSVI